MNDNVMIQRALVAASRAESQGFKNTSAALIEIVKLLQENDLVVDNATSPNNSPKDSRPI